MKMLRCRKCGAAVISDETLIQSILDRYEEALKRAQKTHNSADYARAAEYRSVYKSLMHNISNKDYAEAVTPYKFKALMDEVKRRDLMTEEEITACCNKGEEMAKARKETAEKEIRRIYGEAQMLSASPYRDPTANQAVTNIDKERRKQCNLTGK